MSTMTKVFIVLNAVLTIALSCLFIASAAQNANWRDLAQRYQTLWEAEFNGRVNLSATMEGALAMKDDALQAKARDVDTLQKQDLDRLGELNTAKNDLARQTNDAVEAESGRKAMEQTLGVVTAGYMAMQKQNQTLLSQNMDLQTRNTRLNTRVLELTSSVTIMTDQIRNLQEKLYASEQQVAQLQQQMASGQRVPPSGASPSGAVPVASPMAGPIRGEVTGVDGTYASINVGESSGVVAGLTSMVHRGGSFVAELTIDRVRPSEAGGKLKTVKEPVQVGDTVVYGLEAAGR